MTGGKHMAAPHSERDADKEPPRFSLRYLRGDYCLSKCDKDQRASFADRLHKLSQSSWADLRMMGRHGLGYERLPRDQVSKQPPMTMKPDAAYIVFRFHANRPIVGHKDSDGTFYIFWLDRDFSLYDHG